LGSNGFMSKDYALPALKENVDVVEVNALKVNVGDTVAKDQPLLEVQADKAALEVPSPVAGKVSRILVKVGDQVKIGQNYISIEAGEAGAAPAAVAPKAAAAPPKAEAPKAEAPAASQPSSIPAPKSAPAAAPAPARGVAVEERTVRPIVASPGVRRLAREMGVDLSQVAAQSGSDRVAETDLKAFVKQIVTSGGAGSSGGIAVPSLPRFEEHGAIERQPLTAIRRATAKQMSLAWSQIPHVTQNDLADITDLEAYRKSTEGKGPKITVTAFVLKALAIALKEFPSFNSSLDLANNQLILKKYVNIGVAVDTEMGLLVPVLKEVEHKSVTEIANEVGNIAERARARKLDSSELSGGTFTLTNLGGIGGTGFTPIVNWPEVAILGLSRGRQEFVPRNGQPVVRLLLPLSLSYDHRVVDGAQAARFLRRVAGMLETPLSMLLHA